ncbi:MAG: recombinase family protein [Planctomycetaceae bacterium]|nr:recombinase family protein [Planctomycetaceae bacterium]
MTEKTLMPAVGYIRMSTDKQEDSPARQRAEIERLAERQGFSVIQWYEDHGQTGTESKNRQQFQQLLLDASSGRFRAVLMYEQSRFSREDALDAMLHWRLLRDAGVRLVTCQRGEIRFDDLSGLLTAIVGQHEARSESVRLAQRSLSGREMKARQGIHLVTTPFGFDREIVDESGAVVRRVVYGESFSRPKSWTSRLIPTSDPRLVDAIRSAFDGVLKGRSARSLAIEWNRAGLRTRKGRPFTPSKLFRILRNPVYAGVLRFGFSPRGKFARIEEETIYVRDAHPGIVDLPTFEAVQEVLEATGHECAARDPGRYLLSGLVVCGHCGAPMAGSLYSHPSYCNGPLRRYRCHASTTGLSDCPVHPMIDADALERMVLRLVRKHILCDRNQAELVKAARELEARRGAPSLEKQQLSEVRRKIERGTQNLALADAENFDGIKRLLSSWREQEKALLARVDGLAISSVASSDLLRAVGNLQTIRDHLELANRPMLAAALRQSLTRITVWKQVRQDAAVTLKAVSGKVEFHEALTPDGPIPFDDWEFDPSQPYVHLVDYIRRAGRPVRATELAHQFSLSSAAYHARRGGLAGLIEYIPGSGWQIAAQ